jgi:nucleotide-binding universal stress UspA family protein
MTINPTSHKANGLYPYILVTLDGNPSDRAIIDHIKPLALASESHITLLHVADGWAARTHGNQAVSSEISADEKYLKAVKDEFIQSGLTTNTFLAFGDPATEIIKWINNNPCNLIAMSTHGHTFWGDFFLGSTSRQIKHSVTTPILLVKAS